MTPQPPSMTRLTALLREDRRRRDAWLSQRLLELDAEDRDVLLLDRLRGA